MKYSIITPVYNAELYIEECIESVIAQTYSDWELILVDDGSTDKSSQICDEYANKDSRIKVLHVKNGGAYKARLIANDYIEGGYTLGLDSDDMYAPNCLEIIEMAREKTDADMIVFGRSDFECDTNISRQIKFIYESGKVYTREEMLENALLFTDHALWNKAVKSEIYKTVAYITEEYRLSMSLDYMQVVPLLCGINNAYAIDENLYIYRIREDSLSHNYKFVNIADNDWLNFKLREYLSEKGLYSERIRYALEKSFADVMLPRLFSIRWEITSKEKRELRKMLFLNTMTNDICNLTEDKCEKALIKYVRRGMWGPKGIVYKIFLKYYIKPMKKEQ